MSKINIVFDATGFDTFISCPAKFNYRMNLNKVTPVKSAPLDKGGIVHVGNEWYYKALSEGKDFVAALDIGLAKARISLGTDSDLSTADGEWTISTIEQNLTFWRLADINLTIHSVEKTFAIVLYEDDTFRIVWIGKIDLLISDKEYSQLPVDHKTYSRDFPVHRKTNQFSGYSYAMKSNFLMVNRIGFQTSLKPEAKFKRLKLSYDSVYHEQWRNNVIKWCMFYYDCAESNEWMLNDTSCDKYNRLCEYFEVCNASGQETKEYKLNVNFKTSEPWDVTKLLEEGKE